MAISRKYAQQGTNGVDFLAAMTALLRELAQFE
jgi:hypothetical protein